MALRARPEPAVRYRLSQYLVALVHGKGDVELRRGDRVLTLSDAETRQFVEAVEDYEARRRAESRSPVSDE